MKKSEEKEEGEEERRKEEKKEEENKEEEESCETTLNHAARHPTAHLDLMNIRRQVPMKHLFEGLQLSIFSAILVPWESYPFLGLHYLCPPQIYLSSRK